MAAEAVGSPARTGDEVPSKVINHYCLTFDSDNLDDLGCDIDASPGKSMRLSLMKADKRFAPSRAGATVSTPPPRVFRRVSQYQHEAINIDLCNDSFGISSNSNTASPSSRRQWLLLATNATMLKSPMVLPRPPFLFLLPATSTAPRPW